MVIETFRMGKATEGLKMNRGLGPRTRRKPTLKCSVAHREAQVSWPGMWRYPKAKWETRGRARGENFEEELTRNIRGLHEDIRMSPGFSNQVFIRDLGKNVIKGMLDRRGLQWTGAVRKER